MKVTPTAIPGAFIIEPVVHRDKRGFLYESYRRDLLKNAGIDVEFVQENHSRSIRDTLRGIHLRGKSPEAKLVRAVVGEIFDVVVDLRVGSPTFGRWVGERLSADNCRQMFVPQGCGHAFVVLSDAAEAHYKCSRTYDPADELHVLWNDPDIAVKWPVDLPILSEKDRRGQRLADVKASLSHYGAL